MFASAWSGWGVAAVLASLCGSAAAAQDAGLDAFGSTGLAIELPAAEWLTAPFASPSAGAFREGDEGHYVEPRSTGTRRETDPPRYVRNLSRIDWFASPEATWLDLGLDYRARFEYRDDDLRQAVGGTDQPFLLRTRAYVGVREILDPLRFAVEFEDARSAGSRFPPNNRDVNENELIQLYGELFLEHGAGADRPLRLQAGRVAFEALDRRLIARNEWRNTTNNFQGLRAILGGEADDWQLDLFALKPLERLIRRADDERFFRPDRVDRDRWFYGAIGHWRRWSEIITLEPYYLLLDQDATRERIAREIRTLALRGYGLVGATGFDYDFNLAAQFGRHGAQRHRAFGATAEAGYTWEGPWKPRLGLIVGYGSGDRRPDDDANERFDRLFGFARPWSANDYFLWENLLTPKVRLDVQPHAKVRLDMGSGAFWLASATDFWANANRRDPTGQSGDFVGHELDVRLRCHAGSRVDVAVGYAHFIAGAFTRNTGRGDDTDFFYIETSTRLFK